jgi:hypothetical protein
MPWPTRAPGAACSYLHVLKHSRQHLVWITILQRTPQPQGVIIDLLRGESWLWSSTADARDMLWLRADLEHAYMQLYIQSSKSAETVEEEGAQTPDGGSP